MRDTKTLIEHLGKDALVVKQMRAPRYWAVRVIAILLVYGLIVQLFSGLRADLAIQFMRPAFVLEILLLAALLFSSILAAILAMYPDSYQKPKLLSVPYGIFIALAALIISQLNSSVIAPMVIPPPGAHAMECTLSIAAIALLPSAILFALLRYGASVHPFRAGTFAVLAASSIGCLTLRLAEANDSLMHLTLWHYLPTLGFAALGATLGKWLLKW